MQKLVLLQEQPAELWADINLGSKLGYVVGAVPTAIVAAPVGAIDGIGKAVSGKGGRSDRKRQRRSLK